MRGWFDVVDVVVVVMFSGKLAGVRVAVGCVTSRLTRGAPVSDFSLPFAFLAFSMGLGIIEEGFHGRLHDRPCGRWRNCKGASVSGLLDQDCKVGEVACEGRWVTVQRGNKTCVTLACSQVQSWQFASACVHEGHMICL